jgi:hypothetical protein
MAMVRRAGLLLALLSLAGGASGCKVDTGVSADEVFACDGTSPDADASCGDGWICYRATSYGGSDVCLQSSSAASGCPDGYVASGRGCFKECTFADGECPQGLRCVRTRLTEQKGVCAPLPTCNSSADCVDPVRSYCLADGVSTFAPQSTNSLCVQTQCMLKQEACSPGNTCILGELASIEARSSSTSLTAQERAYYATIQLYLKTLGLTGRTDLDFCAPDCGPHLPCPAGTYCLGNSFQNAILNVCVPGYLGLGCDQDIDCQVGTCIPVSIDTGEGMRMGHACSQTCTDDSQCSNLVAETGVACRQLGLGLQAPHLCLPKPAGAPQP